MCSQAQIGCNMTNETKLALDELRATLALKYENELRGQLVIMANQIKLEVDEAKVCLDRENPNIPMALNRLNDIQIVIDKAIFR